MKKPNRTRLSNDDFAAMAMAFNDMQPGEYVVAITLPNGLTQKFVATIPEASK